MQPLCKDFYKRNILQEFWLRKLNNLLYNLQLNNNFVGSVFKFNIIFNYSNSQYNGEN